MSSSSFFPQEACEEEVDGGEAPEHCVGDLGLGECGTVGVDVDKAFHAPCSRDYVAKFAPGEVHGVAWPGESRKE